MSEREIRDTIQRLCDDLDGRARAAARNRARKVVYPLMVGAGLLVATCDDDPGGQDLYGGPTAMPTGTGSGTTTTGGGTTSGTSTGTGGGQGGDAGAGGQGGGQGGAAGNGGQTSGGGGAGG